MAQSNTSIAPPRAGIPRLDAGGLLEYLYASLNHRRYVAPDPLQTLYAYESPADREIAGLVAASLAFGNVRQILRSVEAVLEAMSRPVRFLRESTETGIHGRFAGFRHRYVNGRDLAQMLCGAKRTLEAHGSLEKCFLAYQPPDAETVIPGLCGLAEALGEPGGGQRNYLLPSPFGGSACKRWHLFLRWMVRRDDVDPGGWDAVSPAQLVAPLDTHMHRLALHMGLTRRRGADGRAALEVTEAFRQWAPDDPVKYDFALTRLGIRRELDPGSFCEAWSARES